MAHAMNDPEQPPELAGEALDRLVRAAGRSPADARRVDLLLGAVAVIVERPPTAAPMPEAERDLWASVGARFDRDLEADDDRRFLAAFGDLLDRSVIGDAALATLLGVDRSRISQRVSERSLYAFSAGEERCFPRWQLPDGKPLRGLRSVLGAVDPELHPLRVDRWFTSPNADLTIDDQAVDPVTWLTTGGSPAVAAALAPGR